MAAPNIIRFEIRDPRCATGYLTFHGSTDATKTSAYVQRTNPDTGLTTWCHIVGANNDYYRWEDYDPGTTDRLNRPAIDNVAAWGTIGGLAVTAVGRKSIAYDYGHNSGRSAIVSMKHYVYVKLANNLPQGGPYNVVFPAATGLPNTSFTFNDKSTRCSSLHATQVGHRPGDTSKLAYLSVWIPTFPNHGTIEFANTYGLTTFNLLNSANGIVYTGSITPTATPTSGEYASQYNECELWYVADITKGNVSQFQPGNVISFKVNGMQVGPITFTTDHATTVQLIINAIVALFPGVVNGNQLYQTNSVGWIYDFGSYIKFGVSMLIDFTELVVSGGSARPRLYVGTNSGDAEYGAGNGFRLRDTTNKPLNIVGLSKTNPAKITYSGTGFVPTRKQIHFQGVNYPFWASPNGLTVAPFHANNIDTSAKTFEVDQDASAVFIPFNANFVTGNIISGKVNGTPIANVTFTTSHTNTMNLLIAAVNNIAGFISVANGVSLEVHALNPNTRVSMSEWKVTGGASQAGIMTTHISFSANLVTGNQLTGTINGHTIGPVTFATSHAATVTAIATAITAADPNVFTSIQSTFDPLDGYQIGIGSSIGDNGTNFADLKVTGGASQPLVRTEYYSWNQSYTVGWAPWLPGQYLTGFSDLIYDTWQTNRAGTYLYTLDYGNDQRKLRKELLAPGAYRIQIPGLGVTYPFQIDDSVWYKVANNAHAGYYHQCNGLAMDGRFGRTRPASLADGVNQFKIYQSYQPIGMCSEFGTGVIATMDTNCGGLGPWNSGIQIVGAKGGWKDAGDWDDQIQAHTAQNYFLLDVWQNFQPGANTNFGFPKANTIFDSTLYAGTHVLGDAVHQAIFHMEFFRATQNALVSGGVGGGMEFYPSPVANNGGYGGGGGYVEDEPSWMTTTYGWMAAPDPASNYVYAESAAKLAVVLKNAGFNTCANTWKNSAVSAWNWAEGMVQSYFNGNGSVVDAYYKGTCNIMNNFAYNTYNPANATSTATVTAGQPPMTNASYAAFILAQMNTAQNISSAGASGPRVGAAGTMLNMDIAFSLGSQNTYINIIEGREHFTTPNTNPTGVLGLGAQGDVAIAMWEYYNANTSFANASYRSQVSFNGFGFSSAPQYTSNTINSKTYNLGYFYTTNIAGVNVSYYDLLYRDILVNKNNANTNYIPTYLDAMSMTMNHAMGGNQMGVCWPVGLGVVNSFGGLCTDSEFAGWGIPFPGHISYVYTRPMGLFVFLNFSSELVWQYVWSNPINSTSQVMDPGVFAFPPFECIIENKLSIGQMEFTTEQTIIPQQNQAIILHSWDGNTTTTSPATKIRMRLKTGS